MAELTYKLEFINQSGVLIPSPTGVPTIETPVVLYQTPNNFTVLNVSNLYLQTVYANLSPGSNGQVLTSNGTAVNWTTIDQSSVNTNFRYYWTNNHTFNASLTVNTSIVANGSVGSAGQVLTSNGSIVFWTTPIVPSFSVNTNAAYGWTNNHIFNSGIAVNTTITANGTVGSSGQVLTSNSTGVFWSTPVIPTFSVNTNAVYAWTNNHIFNTGLVVNTTVNANGSVGALGQVLTSNTTGVFWSTPATFSVNTNARYFWTNTHTFSTGLVVNTSITANGSVGTNGQFLTSNGTGVNWTTPTDISTVERRTSVSAVWNSTTYPISNDAIAVIPVSPAIFTMNAVSYWAGSNASFFTFTVQYKNTFAGAIQNIPGLTNIFCNTTLAQANAASPFVLPIGGLLQIYIVSVSGNNASNSFITITGNARN